MVIDSRHRFGDAHLTNGLDASATVLRRILDEGCEGHPDLHVDLPVPPGLPGDGLLDLMPPGVRFRTFQPGWGRDRFLCVAFDCDGSVLASAYAANSWDARVTACEELRRIRVGRVTLSPVEGLSSIEEPFSIEQRPSLH